MKTAHSIVWDLVRRQHGVVTRRQLLELGFSSKAIEHRIAKGKLHTVYRGVYAVGRPQLTELGTWMAAVLACGPGAVLSHFTAGLLWRLWDGNEGVIEVVVPLDRRPRQLGIVAHRRNLPPKRSANAKGFR